MEKYGDEDKIMLDNVEYYDRVLKPEVMIVAVYWPDQEVRVLEVVNFRTRRKRMLVVVKERFDVWKEEMAPWQIHAIWNPDMHIVSNRRIVI